jgi:hypothetical protein
MSRCPLEDAKFKSNVGKDHLGSTGTLWNPYEVSLTETYLCFWRGRLVRLAQA